LIDLHCHMLPGIDDGAKDVGQSLEMARISAAEGVTVVACTPHMTPGVYDNVGPDVRARVQALQEQIDNAGICLQVVAGADVHVAPDLVSRLRSGLALSLNGSRYVLLETPHHVAPPRLEALVFDLMSAGYVPVFTHPERLTWIDRHYDLIKRLFQSGVWMQITAGSITGRFGERPRYWAERMLDEGVVHVVATDAHDPVRRPPLFGEAYDALTRRVGEAEANNMVVYRPYGVLQDESVAALPPPLASASVAEGGAHQQPPFWRSVVNLWRGV
jgi:protein-tyrosine phosphatase